MHNQAHQVGHTRLLVCWTVSSTNADNSVAHLLALGDVRSGVRVLHLLQLPLELVVQPAAAPLPQSPQCQFPGHLPATMLLLPNKAAFRKGLGHSTCRATPNEVQYRRWCLAGEQQRAHVADAGDERQDGWAHAADVVEEGGHVAASKTGNTTSVDRRLQPCMTITVCAIAP